MAQIVVPSPRLVADDASSNETPRSKGARYIRESERQKLNAQKKTQEKHVTTPDDGDGDGNGDGNSARRARPVAKSASGNRLLAPSSTVAEKSAPTISRIYKGHQASEHPELFTLMGSYLAVDSESTKRYIVNHLEYTLARSINNVDDFGTYQATALSVNNRLIEFWNDTQHFFTEQRAKRVYYMSIEFLLGRALSNAILNLRMRDLYTRSVRELGYRLEDLVELEPDAALGNGGLGRLAACYIDSLASQNYPAWGYGIRYSYGMFRQELRDGFQREAPDAWLTRGNPWEVERNDVQYEVGFYGTTRSVRGDDGRVRFVWEPAERVVATAFDTPIPGFNTKNTLNLRLWASRPSTELNLSAFDTGDYYRALEERQRSEQISAVLYPNDSTVAGRELRLKQQYFFSSATLRDIVRRVRKVVSKEHGLRELADHAAIQLNDTHPTIAIAELYRLLIDEENFEWDDAADTVTRVFAYTNHTVMPEALERWPVSMITRLLPRHMQLIYEINARFLRVVEARWPGEGWRKMRMSIIDDGDGREEHKLVRMAYLAIVCSHKVNGVAKIHSDIIKHELFADFAALYPDKFCNITNGVTPRRWIASANPALAAIITEEVRRAAEDNETTQRADASGGASSSSSSSPSLPRDQVACDEAWLLDLSKLSVLRSSINSGSLQERFAAAKHENKLRLAALVRERCGGFEVLTAPEVLYDVQVKRIHEYKRQLMNILGVIAHYLHIKSFKSADERSAARLVPRVHFFAGKAAPAYHKAKAIIKLITAVGDVVNKDADCAGLLQVVFLPNYNVSLAEVIIPASDVSEHISTAGTEASGTSNMKFAMNGGLIIGTLDGANIEIADEIGRDNMFIFGATADQVAELRACHEQPIDARLYDTLRAIETGRFGAPSTFAELITPLWQGHDYYLLTADFAPYLRAQRDVADCFAERSRWLAKCIASVAGMGKFSSDRAVEQYAESIWNIKRHAVPVLDDDEDNGSAKAAE